ncbi:MAG: hypothetical protein O2954_17300 [bacterium]|nr:hypothetical protein [bacterium]
MKLVTKVWRVVPALMCILFWATVWGQEARKGVDDPFEAYQSDRPKTILDLQPFRSTVSAVIEDGTGRQGTATLVDVNPRVNVWYLLTLEWADGTRDVYHLENPRPDLQTVTVDARYPYGPVFITNKLRDACDLWKDRKVLSEAQASGVPYAPVCNGRLYVRNPTKGHKTTLEWGGRLPAQLRSSGRANYKFCQGILQGFVSGYIKHFPGTGIGCRPAAFARITGYASG